MNGNTVPKLAPDISVQDLGDHEGAVILHLKTGDMHTCNDTTADYLKLVDGSSDFDTIVSKLSQTYEVERETLFEDMRELSQTLMESGILDRQ